MIPRRAFFFYEGQPMSWLRRQSIDTFKLCNPGWQVDIIDGCDIPIKKNGDLSIVHRSDWARYRELHKNGGFYFDTDIAFCKPVPQEWTESSLVLPFGPDGQTIGNVAVMGCEAGEPFFADADVVCGQIVKEREFLGYQALGVDALNKTRSLLRGREIFWVSPSAFLPIAWHETEKLWNDRFSSFPCESIGIHWFGGDQLSKHVEMSADESWLGRSRSLVATSIKRARAVVDHDSLLEHHGIA